MSEQDSYDESYKDKKYFVNAYKYNCPFCKRGHVSYSVVDYFQFDWSKEKTVYGYIIKCDSCEGRSLHLSNLYWKASSYANPFSVNPYEATAEEYLSYDQENLDQYFFYKKPTSFFVIDNRIPKVIRELIAEAEGCRDMGFMTGASGALRKAIYKFFKHENLQAKNYEDKIKELKGKYSLVPIAYIDALANVQGMTSTNLHEDFDFAPWNSEEFTFLIKAFKELMMEIYVKPDDVSNTLKQIQELNPFNRKKQETAKQYTATS